MTKSFNHKRKGPLRNSKLNSITKCCKKRNNRSLVSRNLNLIRIHLLWITGMMTKATSWAPSKIWQMNELWVKPILIIFHQKIRKDLSSTQKWMTASITVPSTKKPCSKEILPPLTILWKIGILKPWLKDILIFKTSVRVLVCPTLARVITITSRINKVKILALINNNIRP